MLFLKTFFIVVPLLCTSFCWALSPAADFKTKDSFGSISNLQHSKEDIELSVMETDITFSDLGTEGIKELNSLFEAKKEYGKMFGFKEWTPLRQKLFEDDNGRTFVLEGFYKDGENKTVNFLEVYWASKTKSGQFLVTSNSKKLPLEEFKRHFIP